MAWTIFWVQNLKFSIFWGFSKMNIFWGMKKLWILFWSLHYWTNLGGHFCTFYGFFLRQGTELESYLGHKILNIYLGMPDIPDIFMPPKELWEAYSNRTVRPSVSPSVRPSVSPSVPLSCPVHISYIL